MLYVCKVSILPKLIIRWALTRFSRFLWSHERIFCIRTIAQSMNKCLSLAVNFKAWPTSWCYNEDKLNSHECSENFKNVIEFPMWFSTVNKLPTSALEKVPFLTSFFFQKIISIVIFFFFVRWKKSILWNLGSGLAYLKYIYPLFSRLSFSPSFT